MYSERAKEGRKPQGTILFLATSFIMKRLLAFGQQAERGPGMDNQSTTWDTGNARRHVGIAKASIFLIFALCALAGCGFRSNSQSGQSTQFSATIQGGNQVLTTVPGAFSNLH